MSTQKMTILPLHHSDWRLKVPVAISGGLIAENVEQFLQAQSFDLWHDYISKQERDDLSSTKIGLVHRFISEEHARGKNEADSADTIYKAFLLLRLIRPTRARYSNVQFNLRNGQADIVGFTQPQPWPPSTPNLQTFNMINNETLSQLAQSLPKFLKFAESSPWHLTRAVRHFEAGYSQIQDPLLQFVTWTMGIESLFAEDKDPVSDDVLVQRIESELDRNTNIYSEVDVELLAAKPAAIQVKDLLFDILKLRNCAIHGIRVPPEFDDRTSKSPATGEAVHYVDVLREGTSFVLRKLILKAISQVNA
jgi:hypothetical protein